MTPIIDPWIVYAIGIVQGVRDWSTAVAIVAGIIFAVGLLCWTICKVDRDYADYVPTWARMTNRSALVFAIFMFLAIFAPSRRTVVWMVVADNVTYERVEDAAKIGKDIKDELQADILAIIDAINKSDKRLRNSGESRDQLIK